MNIHCIEVFPYHFKVLYVYFCTYLTVHVPIIHNNVVANEMHKKSWPIILGKINMVKGPFYIYLNIYQDTTSPIDAK